MQPTTRHPTMRPLTLLLCSLLAALAAVQRAAAAPAGHALVIGNAAYQGETPLVNTLNDARDMAAKLNKLGFEVTKVENAGLRELTRAVNDFHRRIQRDDKPALLYYSGHGMQLAGTNYLIPVDARIRDELDVGTEGVSLNRLLDGLRGRADDAVNLVVLDACRDNPFKKDGNKSIGGKGLSRVKAPRGTLILYAASPGETASDNPGGRNGLFTQYLLRAMDRPGVQVEQTFKQVAYNVYRDSGKRQSPWQEGVIYGRFYFVPPVPPVPPVVPQAPQMVPPPPPAALGYLQVRVDVPAARVFVNGRPAGEAGQGQPLNLRDGLPVGRVRVRVEAGGKRLEQDYAIRPNQWTQAWFSLAAPPSELADQPAPRPEPPAPAAPIARQLTTCQTHLAANRLTTGAGGNALACYQKVLGQDPDNAAALAGIAAIEARYARWADGNLSRGRLDRVARYLERITAINPDSPRLAELQQRLEAARTAAPSAPAAAPAGGRRQSFEPEMVRIPGGSFQMGSNKGDSDEKPVHRVRVQPFLIGKYEVTQAQWRAVMGSNPSHFSGCDRCPVEQVSWDDVQTYVRKLNAKTGRGYRLPTEAEWEYACRSGGRDQTYCGGNDPGALAWYFVNSGSKTHPVGRKSGNGFGLHDMSGNVWEWVEDCWNGSYRGAPADGSAWTGGDCGRRVLRGGSWSHIPLWLRSAYRLRDSRGLRTWSVGLRLARAI